MRPIKTFKIGSAYFFDALDDYVVKDIDELCIMDSFIPVQTNVLNMKIKDKKKDVFFWRNMSKEGFIDDALRSGTPMRAGKFLIPEFNEYIGLTIGDLKRLEPLFEAIDPKHSYERIIYGAYIENGNFTLTDVQRSAAYQEYRKTRGLS